MKIQRLKSSVHLRIIYNIIGFLVFKALFIYRNYSIYSALGTSAQYAMFSLFLSITELCRSLLGEGVTDILLTKKLTRLVSNKDIIHVFKPFLTIVFALYAILWPLGYVFIIFLNKTEAFKQLSLSKFWVFYTSLFLANGFMLLHLVYDCLLTTKGITFVRIIANIFSMLIGIFFIKIFQPTYLEGEVALSKICFSVLFTGFFNMFFIFVVVILYYSEILLPKVARVTIVFKDLYKELFILSIISLIRKVYCSFTFDIFAIIKPEIIYFIAKCSEMIYCNIVSLIIVPLNMVLTPYLSRAITRGEQHFNEKAMDMFIRIALFLIPVLRWLQFVNKHKLVSLFIDVNVVKTIDFAFLVANLNNYVSMIHIEVLKSYVFLVFAIKGRYKIITINVILTFLLQTLFFYFIKDSVNAKIISSVARIVALFITFIILLLQDRMFLNLRLFVGLVQVTVCNILASACMYALVIWFKVENIPMLFITNAALVAALFKMTKQAFIIHKKEEKHNGQ